MSMDKSYWNKIGAGYNSEIFDAYYEDRTGRLRKRIQRYSDRKKFAIDIGCGTGKAFPYLAPNFGKVLGVDISSELLKLAAKAPFDNIEIRRADLSKPVSLPKADFVFCCNVAILPDMEKNLGIIINSARCLKKDGNAIFVIPSLESSLFSGYTIIQQYKSEGTTFKDIPKEDLSYYSGGTKELINGLVRIDNVPTKHYLEPEIQLIFKQAGFTVNRVERLEYNWTTEFSKPPKKLKDPYPWDWMVDLTKK
jgi:SAM-dependent methyltransferase